MNVREQDIISIIKRHGPMTSAGLQAWLTMPALGYNLDVEQISKIASKMKSNGLLVGEDRPNPGTKPVRYWALPEPVVNDQMTTESDHSEDGLEMVEQSPKEKMNDFLLDKLKEKECTEWKQLLPSKPMSAAKILREFANLGFEDDRAMGAFMDGIAAAERHHGIAE
jgi:hypothetical protein